MDHPKNTSGIPGGLAERFLEVPHLSEDTVHLWRVSLAISPQWLQYLNGILSIDERRRAGQFVFDRDRTQFVAARGLLHVILAGYLNCRPQNVGFRYNAHGRPVLEQIPGAEELSFNVSHTFEQAAFVVSRNHRIGVDIEYIRPMPEIDALVENAFSSRERKKWHTLPKKQQRKAFFRAWTRKEAYLKAIGIGLSYPLNHIEVTFTSSEPPRLLRINGNPELASEWSLVALFPAGNYVGSLAVEGSEWHLQRRSGR
jgi:4'-phosphopantetheinyl transferase